jgi:hypothetical protein
MIADNHFVSAAKTELQLDSYVDRGYGCEPEYPESKPARTGDNVPIIITIPKDSVQAMKIKKGENLRLYIQMVKRYTPSAISRKYFMKNGNSGGLYRTLKYCGYV